MPFGLFVGVNNHFQSIIFGGVLMRDETLESFRWVFKEFVPMVNGKSPLTILTGKFLSKPIDTSIFYPRLSLNIDVPIDHYRPGVCHGVGNH